MMSLDQKLTEQIKAAMIAHDTLRLTVLRSLRAATLEFQKSGSGEEMTPAVEMKILNSGVKKRRETLEMAEKGNRTEMIETLKKEIEIVQEFLPQQLTTEEIKEIVKKVIAESGAESIKDMGKVVGASMKLCTGKADGKLVQEIVRELLS
jgi:uncharacterized protein YqeY